MPERESDYTAPGLPKLKAHLALVVSRVVWKGVLRWDQGHNQIMG